MGWQHPCRPPATHRPQEIREHAGPVPAAPQERLGAGPEPSGQAAPDPYAQTAHGQPAYGSPAYGQPAYGSPPYGLPAYAAQAVYGGATADYGMPVPSGATAYGP